MLLPADFQQTIAHSFYDKDVLLLEKTTISLDGWVDETTASVTGSFKGNVQFNRLAETQAELGLTDRVDVTITCSPNETIKVGDLFSYANITYKASAVIPFDSHLKVVGSKWA